MLRVVNHQVVSCQVVNCLVVRFQANIPQKVHRQIVIPQIVGHLAITTLRSRQAACRLGVALLAANQKAAKCKMTTRTANRPMTSQRTKY